MKISRVFTGRSAITPSKWNRNHSLIFCALLPMIWAGCSGVMYTGKQDNDERDSSFAKPDGGSNDGAVGSDAAPPVDGGPPVDGAPPVDAAPPPVDAAPTVDAGLVCYPTTAKDCTVSYDSYTWHVGTSCYVNKVQQAINRTIAQNPTWFGDHPDGCKEILVDHTQYVDEVTADVNDHGLCAMRDTSEELTVKYDDTFAESFDIVASNGCARRSANIYTGYSLPAWW